MTAQVLSDCNGIPTHNYLVRKRTPNHLTQLATLNLPITL